MNSSSATDSPKISRRQIREATVQLLHATASEEEKGGDPWPLILATANGKVLRVQSRAVLHLQQNRPSRLKPLSTEPAKSLSLLENYLEDRNASRQFRSLLKSEKEISELLDILRRQLKSEKEPETVAGTLAHIQELNLASLQSQTTLADVLGSVDTCPEPLRPMAKALPPLLETSKMLQSLLSLSIPERPETKALREAIAERELLQTEITKLHQLVTSHQKETDQLLTNHLENFAFDRLAQVDRAVLRLATTELTHCPEIPAAVSINEAIEVARRFGGTESAGFVNGVLDKLKSVLPTSD